MAICSEMFKNLQKSIWTINVFRIFSLYPPFFSAKSVSTVAGKNPIRYMIFASNLSRPISILSVCIKAWNFAWWKYMSLWTFLDAETSLKSPAVRPSWRHKYGRYSPTLKPTYLRNYPTDFNFRKGKWKGKVGRKRSALWHSGISPNSFRLESTPGVLGAMIQLWPF